MDGMAISLINSFLKIDYAKSVQGLIRSERYKVLARTFNTAGISCEKARQYPTDMKICSGFRFDKDLLKILKAITYLDKVIARKGSQDAV